MRKKNKIFWGINAIFSVVFISLLYPQVNAYISKPTPEDWVNVDQQIYQKSSLNDFVAFDPEWMSGYALDNHRFRYLSLINAKKILRKKTVSPSVLWFICMPEHGNGFVQKLQDMGYKAEPMLRLRTVKGYRLYKAKSNLFDFQDHFKDATAQLVSPGFEETVPCESGKFIFKTSPYEWSIIQVSPVQYSFGQERINAVTFHPISGSRKILRYHSVPLGEKLEIILGLADSGRQYDVIRTCYFTIKIDANVFQTLKVDERNPDQYWEFDISSFKGKHEVVFEVEAPQGDNYRHLFFRASTFDNP